MYHMSGFRTEWNWTASNCSSVHVHLHGGPAPVRRFPPKLIELILNGTINPGTAFDLALPLTDANRGIIGE
jgi:hypothetical protein